MPETETALEVRRAGDHAAIIAIRGELTGTTDAALMDAYGRAADPIDTGRGPRLQRARVHEQHRASDCSSRCWSAHSVSASG